MIAPAAVPELQKLLMFQHRNDGVRVLRALNDLGRDQPLILATRTKVEGRESEQSLINPINVVDKT